MDSRIKKIIVSIFAFIIWCFAITYFWQNDGRPLAVVMALVGVGVIGSVAMDYYKKFTNRRW